MKNQIDNIQFQINTLEVENTIQTQKHTQAKDKKDKIVNKSSNLDSNRNQNGYLNKHKTKDESNYVP